MSETFDEVSNKEITQLVMTTLKFVDYLIKKSKTCDKSYKKLYSSLTEALVTVISFIMASQNPLINDDQREIISKDFNAIIKDADELTQHMYNIIPTIEDYDSLSIEDDTLYKYEDEVIVKVLDDKNIKYDNTLYKISTWIALLISGLKNSFIVGYEDEAFLKTIILRTKLKKFNENYKELSTSNL
jgi:hypothetical protein